MSEVFTHAVASFDPTTDSVLLWTRLVGATGVHWVLARDARLREIVDSGASPIAPDSDGTVVVDVTGLQPATTYFYGFTAAGEHSPVGRTRTLPTNAASELVLALVACADYSLAPLTVYRALAQREVDLVLHMGDYVYDGGGKGGRRPHAPDHPVRTLADYRTRLGQIRADPDVQAVHLRHPFAAILDDHDLADNAWRGGAKAHQEATDGPWPARAAAAMRARAEWVPCRRPDPADVLRTWRSLTAGDLAELVLLDSRFYGRDQQAGMPGALPPLAAPERTMLGAEQGGWAWERIADTSRPWSLVANGVVVNEIAVRSRAAGLLARLSPAGYLEHDGALVRDDQWDGYPAERGRLLAALAGRRAAGGASVLLSGDVHSSWAFDGPCGPDGEPVTVEVVTPAVSSAPMGRTRLPVLWRVLDAVASRIGQVRFVDVTNRGFVLVHVRRAQVSAGWHWVDPYDPADVPTVKTARWLSVARAQVPPRWAESAPQPAPGNRPDLTELPARPTDVLAARRQHQRRRAAGLAAVASVLAGALALTGRALRS